MTLTAIITPAVTNYYRRRFHPPSAGADPTETGRAGGESPAVERRGLEAGEVSAGTLLVTIRGSIARASSSASWTAGRDRQRGGSLEFRPGTLRNANVGDYVDVPRAAGGPHRRLAPPSSTCWRRPAGRSASIRTTRGRSSACCRVTTGGGWPRPTPTSSWGSRVPARNCSGSWRRAGRFDGRIVRSVDIPFLEVLGAAAGLAVGRLKRAGEAWALDEPPAQECPACRCLTRTGESPECDCGSEYVETETPTLLTRRLGTGGTGAAFLARDLRLERDVAVKTLTGVSVLRLMGLKPEAWAMATVNHPAIAHVYGIESWRNRPFLVVEFLPGGTLADRLRRGPVPAARGVDIGALLADALAALHEAGYKHGDIKPSNVGFTSDGSPKLLVLFRPPAPSTSRLGLRWKPPVRRRREAADRGPPGTAPPGSGIARRRSASGPGSRRCVGSRSGAPPRPATGVSCTAPGRRRGPRPSTVTGAPRPCDRSTGAAPNRPGRRPGSCSTYGNSGSAGAQGRQGPAGPRRPSRASRNGPVDSRDSRSSTARIRGGGSPGRVVPVRQRRYHSRRLGPVRGGNQGEVVRPAVRV